VLGSLVLFTFPFKGNIFPHAIKTTEVAASIDATALCVYETTYAICCVWNMEMFAIPRSKVAACIQLSNCPRLLQEFPTVYLMTPQSNPRMFYNEAKKTIISRNNVIQFQVNSSRDSYNMDYIQYHDCPVSNCLNAAVSSEEIWQG